MATQGRSAGANANIYQVHSNTSINRDGIRYPRPETEEERYQRHQEQARLTGILSSSNQHSAANLAAAAHLSANQPSLIPPIQSTNIYTDSARAASATHGGGPNEVDRRARDAIAIIQLRLLREKLRRERELLNSSPELDDESSSSRSGDEAAEIRIKQALTRRDELLRQVEEIKLGQLKHREVKRTYTPPIPSVRLDPTPAQPQQIVVKVDQPRTDPSEIQRLSAAIKEIATATVAPPQLPTPRPPPPPPPSPPPAPRRQQVKTTTSSSVVGMGEKYQELMEMMMMQSYQMQQMVMQQSLLNAVTQPGAPCGSNGYPTNKPAIVQIAGKKHRHGHSCHGRCGGPMPMANHAAFQPQMGPHAGHAQLSMGGNSQVASAADRKLQQQLEQQQEMIKQMQAQQQQFMTQQQNQVTKRSKTNAAAMLAMQPSSSPMPVMGQSAYEGDPLNMPKDRRREVKEAKLGDIDWNSGDAWFKKDRVAIKMRHFFYVAWFIGSMKAAAAEKGKFYNTEKVAFDDIIAFEIIIREIITGVHRIYLDPDSEMYQLLQTLVSPNAIDLRLALHDSPEATQELIYLLENITFQMTYIQTFLPMRYHLRSLVLEDSYDLTRALAPYYPRTEIEFDQEGNPIEPPTPEQVEEATLKVEDLMLNLVYHMAGEIPDAGVLGTHRRSHLFALIKDGQLFPPEEFWEIEKKLMRFDSNGRTTNIGTREAMMLLIMFFLARGLCWTLLMNPVTYGLTPVEPDPVSKENLKLMASLLIYLYRRLIVPRDARVIPPAPQEIAYMLVRDEVLQPLLERIDNTMTYCDGLVREWANAFVRRLKQALPPKAAPY